MPDRGGDSELNWWRGSTDARLDDIEKRIDGIHEWRDAHEAEVRVSKDNFLQRLTAVETKVMFFAAGGSLLGGAVVALLEWFLGKM